MLFPPPVFESIRSVYNNDPTSTDLFSAGMGESPINPQFRRTRREIFTPPLPNPILGPTFTCLLIDQFERLRDGDRFFYLNDQFTSSQLLAIKKRKFSDIICDNIDSVSVQDQAFLIGHQYSCSKERKRLNLIPWILVSVLMLFRNLNPDGGLYCPYLDRYPACCCLRERKLWNSLSCLKIFNQILLKIKT